MEIENKYPKDFQEFLARFPDENACWHYLIGTRWPKGSEYYLDVFAFRFNRKLSRKSRFA